MKNDLPYFSHDNDARNNPKMKALRARFGWTGYGQFWALNEMIAGAPEARLNLSRKVVRASVACELGMTPDALDDLLEFLADPEECGLVHYEDGVVTTERTQENYRVVSKERESDRRRRGLSGGSPDGKQDNPAGNEQNPSGKSEKAQAKQSTSKAKEIASCARDDSGAKSEEPDVPIAELYAFALKIATEEKHARNPPALAKKLMTEPDIIARFEASRPQPKRNDAFPEPGPCECGGEIKADRWGGTGRCLACGSWVRWSPEWESWLPDDEANEQQAAADQQALADSA